MTFAFAGQYGPQTIANSAGTPLPNLSVNVFVVGSSTPITLYTSRLQNTTTSNPTATDSNGNLTFYAVPGEYDIVGNGERLTVTVGVDPADVATLPGSTYTGAVLLNANPTAALGAATKQYVDASGTPGAAPHNVVAVNTTLHAALAGEICLVTTGSGGIEIILPPTVINAQVTVKKVDSGSGIVSISPQSGQIDGQNTENLTLQYHSATMVCDGTNWSLT